MVWSVTARRHLDDAQRLVRRAIALLVDDPTNGRARDSLVLNRRCLAGA